MALLVIALLALAAPANAADGCVTMKEHNVVINSDSIVTKAQVDKSWGQTGTKTANTKKHVRFDYVACNGATLYVIYVKPNEYHSQREWVYIRFTDTGFGE